MNIDDILKAFNEAHDKDPKSNKFWSYDSGESVENFIRFFKEINKPVETTNEEPRCNCGGTTADKCNEHCLQY